MSTDINLKGQLGEVVVTRWDAADPTFLVALAHGFGEHAGRYAHVAAALNGIGGTVYAPDHAGHGRSEGDRARADKIEEIVTDFAAVVELAQGEHPGLPLVVIGHSMGGVVATRYVQRYEAPAALVLSGPIIGGNPGFSALLTMDPLPDVPLDPAALSRDTAVGEAYAADPLIYHGPLQRESLQGLVDAVELIAKSGDLGDVPTLWLHGEQDPLAPYDATAGAIEKVKGSNLEAKSYEGAMHEIFNETNKDEVIGDVTTFITKALKL
jgi:alpha-beta hydrolase superfamily lysophospholipase